MFPQGNRFGELEKFTTVLFKVIALLGIRIAYSPAKKLTNLRRDNGILYGRYLQEWVELTHYGKAFF